MRLVLTGPGIDRLPWKAARRALVLGVSIGAVLRGLRWSQGNLRERAAVRVNEMEAGAGEEKSAEGAVGAAVDSGRA